MPTLPPPPLVIGRDLPPAEADLALRRGLLRPVVLDVVVPADVAPGPALRAEALSAGLRHEGVSAQSYVAGLDTAYWIHTGATPRSTRAPADGPGTGSAGDGPGVIDLLARRSRTPRSTRVRVHQAALDDDEIVTVAGLEVTSPDRTAADLARILPTTAALACLIRLDVTSGARPGPVAAMLLRLRGARGVIAARATVDCWRELRDRRDDR